MTLSIMTLWIEYIYCYAECHYAECHYAGCYYAECHYAECRYAECHYTECCGVAPLNIDRNIGLE
jgi:hypothetical protein